jgi:hypothetical protein
VAATTTPEASAAVTPEVPAATADQGGGAATAPPAAKADPEPATGDKPLGPEGERALGIWKDRAKTAETELKNLQRERDEALAKLADAGKPEAEQALAAARREAEAAATATVSAAAASAVAKQALLAEAKGRLADPSDAVAFLDVADFKVGADFTVDPAAIAAAVTELLGRKPHLAAKATDGAVIPAPTVPPAGIDQGFREKDAPSLEDQIREAEKSGDFGRAMALKSNQLFAALTARPTT